jgi:hypothetical protein
LKEGSEGREGMAVSAPLSLIKITVLGHEKAAVWCPLKASYLIDYSFVEIVHHND